jgi:hypothetical protein
MASARKMGERAAESVDRRRDWETVLPLLRGGGDGGKHGVDHGQQQHQGRADEDPRRRAWLEGDPSVASDRDMGDAGFGHQGGDRREQGRQQQGRKPRRGQQDQDHRDGYDAGQDGDDGVKDERHHNPLLRSPDPPGGEEEPTAVPST